ncbi:uncharacterized protein STEHIDRAFT_115213 [Stereum hirsutum FP-91666 SS1]|uniref:uncharacterized protein n=1 Tax=Stereum hirsutum (strain FP-91666) TaxID=721885 RepID=UPI0004449C5F|nr:uncharacterized protein STEHIDRAFT_115213 [Stereum hirsutum FP-91666 SS1]EIM81029.1 hypothetical protein STEHIDRAFT_115213 [Stereum hirsutum FP-91666 SS1]
MPSDNHRAGRKSFWALNTRVKLRKENLSIEGKTEFAVPCRGGTGIDTDTPRTPTLPPLHATRYEYLAKSKGRETELGRCVHAQSTGSKHATVKNPTCALHPRHATPPNAIQMKNSVCEDEERAAVPSRGGPDTIIFTLTPQPFLHATLFCQ